jgi:hypothetical protein
MFSFEVPTRAADSSSALAHRPHQLASDSLQLPSLLYSDIQLLRRAADRRPANNFIESSSILVMA